MKNEYLDANDNFAVKSEEIIIFGAGIQGVLCFRWLKQFSPGHRVLFFVDNALSKQGQLLEGVPVHSVKRIKRNPDAVIVICTLRYGDEITEALEKNGIKNSYYFFCADQYISNNADSFSVDTLEQASSLFDKNDKYTNESFLLLEAKLKYNGCLIPADSWLGNAVLFSDYWDEPALSLDFFDACTVIDGGAFTGDTVLDLDDRYGDVIKKYYAFEPEQGNYAKLVALLKAVHLEHNVLAINEGLGEKSDIINSAMSDCGIQNKSDAMLKSVETKIASLDSFELEILGRLCIKMDIEGFEAQALLGSIKTIQDYRPELAICLYHLPDDILKIPSLIKEILPEYKLVIRSLLHMELYGSAIRF